MSIRNLFHLFKPKSVALIGASDRPRSVGSVIMRNLLQGGFTGPIMPVNPKREAVAGVLSYPDVHSLPVVPELAIICTPPMTVPGLITDLAERGTRAAIVVTAGLSHTPYKDGKSVAQAMLEACQPHLFRILGPNCVGLLIPGIGLNASFAHQAALPGRIAFVSQSGALCTLVLDWARAKDIGFSHFISMGDTADISFGDVMDYLGSDPSTRSILLYVESIRQGRSFMSAARSAARNKPVMVIKSGRAEAGAKAAASHTGALAGADAVYDAAFRRAGMLRVYDIAELFSAVETLARWQPSQRAESLAIMTNGGGIGVMAVDDLVEGGGRLAELSDETIANLDKVLPTTWSRSNPVDIIGDAPPERYIDALKILLETREVEAVLCMHAPVAISSATEIAKAVIELAARKKVNLLTCWVGEETVEQSRHMFNKAGIPTYDTPGQAVQAFLHTVRYRQNQEALMQTPPSAPSEFTPATTTARLVVENALADGREVLTEPEAKGVLAAYGIPTVDTHIVRTPETAAKLAEKLGGRLALKILSKDVSHKSDVGGVMLDLLGGEAVALAAHDMLERVAKLRPDAKVTGFTLQPMAIRPLAEELILGVTTDPVFGPVILFGQGGIAVEVIGDRAVALPPLNMTLARDLISRTRVYKLLSGYRDRPPANLDAICLTLMQISQIVIDIPEIVELDINPLFADADGVLALDARIKATASTDLDGDRLAIRPYPKHLEETLTLSNARKVLLRPIRPEDEPSHHIFISKLNDEDKRYRVFGMIRELPHSEMARFTQIDYDREMAFIATALDDKGKPETLGVARGVTDPNNEGTEFAVVVRSDLKGLGIGYKLMNKLIAYSRTRGTKFMHGEILKENKPMIQFAEKLGFIRLHSDDVSIVNVRFKL
jgi:acetyltransferase